MTTMASQITSPTVVYSTVYSDAFQRKHQSSASLAFVWGIHRDRWIPRTKGQLRGKCFHLMTSSCTGHGRIPHTKGTDEELWCFFDLRLNQQLSKQWRRWGFAKPLRPLLRHCNGIFCRIQGDARFPTTIPHDYCPISMRHSKQSSITLSSPRGVLTPASFSFHMAALFNTIQNVRFESYKMRIFH